MLRQDVRLAPASLRLVALLLAAMSLLNVSSLCSAAWPHAMFPASAHRFAAAADPAAEHSLVCHCLKCMMPGGMGLGGRMACCCTGKSADKGSACPCLRGVCDTEETARLNASWTPPAVLAVPLMLRPVIAAPLAPPPVRRFDASRERTVAPPAHPPRFASLVKKNHHCLVS